MQMQYKRVLIKLSGEMLSSRENTLDREKILDVAKALKSFADQGLQMGVMVGGGNIVRGRSSAGMDRTDADHMGMLATVINCLALKDAILSVGGKAAVLSAIEMNQVCELFTKRDAVRRLNEGEIVILGAGSGRPYFSTDTAAALRALEIDADALLCGKACDGVYDKDPRKFPDAKKFDELTYDYIIEHKLEALDQTAIILCRDKPGGGLPIFVFELSGIKNLEDAVYGVAAGTVIH